MKPVVQLLIGAVVLTSAGAETSPVAKGINQFGLDLHRRLAADGGNQVISPWSIHSALAMTYAGAAGKTHAEMAHALHLGDDEAANHADIAAIARDLDMLVRASRQRVENPSPFGSPKTPLQIVTANRLFGQSGMSFEKPFLILLEYTYDAPLEQLDFIQRTEDARLRINGWVEERTKERIKDLVPPGALDEKTRLVLANAIYLKAAWKKPFIEVPDLVFNILGADEAKITGLYKQGYYGHRKIPGGTLLSVPYEGGGLQFLIAMPDERKGLAALEKKIDAVLLAEATQLPKREISLRMPKFKLEPDRIMLTGHLKAMGMLSAFDTPRGSADFSRIAPRKLDDQLFISDVIHKAFIDVNKNGTEAAAATAVTGVWGIDDDEPLDILVDRPFLFAIQHVASGTCLFLGRVTDPR
jgi:serpin B